MIKRFLLTAFIAVSNLYIAQDRAKDSLQAIKEFSKLSADFQILKNKSDAENKKYKDIKDRITPFNQTVLQDSLKIQSNIVLTASKQLDTTHILFESYKNIYLSKGFSKEFITSLYKFEHKSNDVQNPSTKTNDDKVVYFFGNKKVISEDNAIFNDKQADNVLKDILSSDSKAYLGDFRIPQKGQIIDLYKSDTISKKNVAKCFKKLASKYILDGKKLHLQKVRIHIMEGSIYDFQVYLTDNNKNIYFYENKQPISLLKFTSVAADNYIPFKLANGSNIDMSLNTSTYNESFIKVSDVLMYIPNPGENYVPEDLTLTFPDKESEEVHANHPIIYKVQQNTALQNILELRTYTDFLGLFADAPNGLVQLEGKADFFVNPFNYRSFYFFKKITPFVNFSRLDEDIRYLSTQKDASTGNLTINNSLEIIEKSYLEMGLKFTFLSYQIKKEYPFSINLYGAARYQIADIRNASNEAQSMKVLGLGGGLMLDFKRFNNFGFTFASELTNFNVESFNTLQTINNPKDFVVFKNEAEIYYNPAGSKQSSIFLRLKTFNNSKGGNDEAFYQLQFGYRFSIGVNKLQQ